MPNRISISGPVVRKAALIVAAVLAAMLPLAACGGEGKRDVAGAPPPGEGSGSADSSPGATPRSERPNVVLVLADDLDGSVFEDSTLDSAGST